MINKNQTILHIVSEQDSIEKISVDYNIDVNLLYSLNPVLRNHHLYKGMPIIVPIKNETRELDIDDSHTIKRETTFLYRMYIGESFCQISNDILLDRIKNNCQIILQNEKNSSEFLNNCLVLFTQIIKYNDDIIHNLILQNTIEIKKIAKCKQELYQNYILTSLLQNEKNFLNKVKKIDILWQNFIINFSSNQIVEFEKIFNKLIEE